MEDLSHKHIFSIFAVHPQDSGETEHRLLGKFVNHNNELTMLEDHSSGLLDPLKDGLLDEATKRFIRNLANSSRMKLVNNQDLLDGRHPEFLKDAQIEEEQGIDQVGEEADEVPNVRALRPPSVFGFMAQGQTKPAIVTVRGNIAMIDDKELHPSAVKTMIDAAEKGLATIRYNIKAPDVKPSRFESLGKMEKGLSGALGSMKQAVDAGHIHPDAYKALTRELFRDSMVSSTGNRKAYEDFLSRERPGVHIAIDLNGFKSINDTYGHNAGDAAIKAAGEAMRQAIEESGGRKHFKSFRPSGGGDEYSIHAPDHEHAARFARAFRGKLEAIPPVGGTHHLSASIGMGLTPEMADQSMYEAKKAKNQANYAPGKAKTHAHSLVPGFEGPVPVEKLAPPPSVAMQPIKPLLVAPPPVPVKPV